MDCRFGCGACCIAPSISTPIPGMPEGKAAGDRCIQLDEDNLCKLFGHSNRPKVCSEFKAEPITCGETNKEALLNISLLEKATA